MSEAAKRIVDLGSVRPYRSPRQRKQVLVALVVVAVAAALGTGAWFLLAPRTKAYTLRDYETATVSRGALARTTQASGAVSLPVQMSLPSPEEGYAATISVAEGDAVIKGQVLARIDVPSLADSLVDLESTLAEAKRAAARTGALDRIEAARAEREILQAAADVRDAEAEVARLGSLVQVNGARQSELQAAQKTLEKLAATKAEKEAQLSEQRELAALDEQAARAKVADLEVQIVRLKERIADATIRSPMKGEVLEVASALSMPGSLITEGTPLITVADPSSAIVELEVDEQYSSLLGVGQSVKLTIGSASIEGRITGIGKVAAQSSDGLGATVTVRVKPVGATTALLQGSTAVGEIDLGSKESALLLPRGPYLTTGSQRWLYKITGNTARRVAVTFGATEGNTVEVLSGVSEGDTVITSGYQNFIEYSEVVLAKGETK